VYSLFISTQKQKNKSGILLTKLQLQIGGAENKPKNLSQIHFKKRMKNKKGKNSRIYKIGDLVRWLLDGNLDYIRRNDFKVKIRGFRIELEEIESILLEYEGIKQCVELAKERKFIISYIMLKRFFALIKFLVFILKSK
jgi:acyl-coenzyme A synthetase/AMP-(fatty) acid ligase